ncbi:MAG: hypothetical protein KME07_16170 [Pegethrix bostrychoides GSE-TBD4-15B]|jgi:predicted RNA-binding Zn-ribbon protein involved in translation (DUF1610 family)|uniref:DUF6671 domain-containing protein n=1 Tax=Pegethrix bostrychoides GSE-TBD4-15B TaxID=2839662 RepID=A0A951PD33_9CYAN|nr:hypothetical protein [Pegethrix bostrychoides GSE-TBD4-15B]
MSDAIWVPQLANRTAVLATMHGKEQVIAPLLAELGISVLLPSDLNIEFNTDQFGTFSREIKRAGNQQEAARMKAARAMQLTGLMAIASEGAFGPHPALPYLPCDRELVLLLDPENQLEIWGEALSTKTNFSQAEVRSQSEAEQFAQKIGFPQHGLILRAENQLIKGIVTAAELASAVEHHLVSSGSVMLETDMRAQYNPQRMQVIQQATQNLVQKICQTCPNCGWPGFDILERQPGLPCAWCHQPTELTLANIYACQHCGHRQAKAAEASHADPVHCAFCNP